MGLKRITAPTAKLLTPEELKQQISQLDDADNDYLDRLLDRATAKAEKVCGRAFLAQQWRLTLDRFPTDQPFQAIPLPRPPVLYLPLANPARPLAITYTDEAGNGQTLNASLYLVAADSQPARVAPAYNETWPATRCIPEAVSITYWAGYGEEPATVPDDAKHAVALIVADWFMNREATAPQDMKPVPLNAQWLLDGLKTGVQPGCYELGN